ncbi:MAG: ASKHA domain-containing protein [Candidatus Firestonebacteria bacterium]
MDVIERRRAERITMLAGVKLKEKEYGIVTEGTIVNISTLGLGVLSSQTIPRGKQLSLFFDLSGNINFENLSARVIRGTQLVDNHYLALEFTDITDEHKGKIDKFVESFKCNFSIIFQPYGKKIVVPAGTKIKEAAALAGIMIETPCGGQSKCGKCYVEVITGLMPANAEESKILQDAQLPNNFRLSCKSVIQTNTVVRIPEETLLYTQKILAEGVGTKVVVQSAVKKIYIEMEKPSLDKQIGDWDNLKYNLKGIVNSPISNLDMLKNLSKKLKESDFKITVTSVNNEIIDIEKGNTVSNSYGMAFDIGTTTVVGSLIDLGTGEVKAVVPAMNPQVVYGDDVISRIKFSITESDGLKKVHSKIIDLINDLISKAVKVCKIDKKSIYEITIVGNSTMQHFFLGVSPENLGFLPYVPVIQESCDIKACDLKLDINPNGNVHILPNIAGYVGADTVGVILSASLHKSEKIKLAIDIGTNGEIVLGSKDLLVSCSTAAGPAFEGVHISCGMRAASGAIDKVKIENDDIFINVIEGAVPHGICGTGLVDAVAVLLSAGIIDETGRILSKGELDKKVSAKLAARIVEGKSGYDFILWQSDTKKILLTQKDVRELQLAKGAIRSGIESLKKNLKISNADIEEVLLAGAFGNYLKPESALRIGLIPDFPLSKVKSIGNAAFEGAKMALVSVLARKESDEIGRKAKYIELSTVQDFNEEFSNAMMFPKWQDIATK